MLFYCEFSRCASTSPEALRLHVLEQHRQGGNHQDRIEAIYTFAEEGTGFLVVEFEDRAALHAALESYRGVLNFDVRPMGREINYEEEVGIGVPQCEHAVSDRGVKSF